MGSGAQAQQLWCMDLEAPWHVESSQTKDQTRAPSTGRGILIHCVTTEVPLPHHLALLAPQAWLGWPTC